MAVAAYERVTAVLPGALSQAAPVSAADTTKRRLQRAVRKRPVAPRVAGAVAVLATALLGASVAWGLSIDRTLDEERTRHERVVGAQEIVFEVVDSPLRSRLVLRSPVEGSTSYGKVFVRPDLPHVVAMVGRLPAPAADRRYHLWLTFESGETVLAGTFVPSGDGFASLLYDAGRNGPSLRAVRVTEESQGASAPGSVPVLLWSAP